MSIRILIAVLVSLTFSGALIASETPMSDFRLKQKMADDIDFVRGIYDVRYAPKEWKQSFSGWNLETATHTTLAEIEAMTEPSVRKYQRVFNQFIVAMKDYHVRARFYSTETATLPFQVKGAEGKYFFVWIDREKLPSPSFPFNLGDEVVALGDRPLGEVVAELKADMGGNTSETDQSLAEIFVTRRAASRAMTVPRGPVTLTVKPRGSDKDYLHEMIWDYTPELISGGGIENTPVGLRAVQKSGEMSPKAWLDGKIAARSMAVPGMAEILAESPQSASENRFVPGTKRTFLPNLGLKLWESDPAKSFHAYLFRNEQGKLVGYVRIPSYGAGENEAREFASVMTYFQATTDSLVIDQFHNPGGSVFYLYSLVSMLTDQAFMAPKHRMTITQEDVAEAVMYQPAFEKVKTDAEARALLGETLGGYPVSYEVARFLVEFFRFEIAEWNAGRTTTKPYFLWGVQRINPSPVVQYTKPVLLLTDELDFSGGDFFPAILQDNKRVTILGARTAGAGGYVLSQQYPNQFGVQLFTVTGSYAERLDLNPIENLGVKPDLPYQLTAADLQGGFQGLAQAVR
ncbi:MAG: protease-like activity factor CPAF, partial [Bdellovibrionota bacterium]